MKLMVDTLNSTVTAHVSSADIARSSAEAVVSTLLPFRLLGLSVCLAVVLSPLRNPVHELAVEMNGRINKHKK